MTNSYEGTTIQINPQEQGPCALVQDLLPLYIEGEVSPGSRDVIVEHLARCERCAGFLAGAQTVRVQLRREQAVRPVAAAASMAGAPASVSALVGVAPSSPLLGFFISVGALGLSALGSIGTIMLFEAPDGANVLGLVLVALAFGLLLLLGKLRGPWTARRLALLTSSCALGALITLGLFATGGHDPLGMLINFALGSVTLVGVWRAVAHIPAGAQGVAAPVAATAQAGNSAPAGPSVARSFTFPLKPRHIVAIGVVIALLIAGVMMMQTVSLTINTPIFMFALLGMAAILWYRDHR